MDSTTLLELMKIQSLQTLTWTLIMMPTMVMRLDLRMNPTQTGFNKIREEYLLRDLQMTQERQMRGKVT